MDESKTDPAGEGDAAGIDGLCFDPMVEEALGFKHKRRSLQEIVQSTRKEAAELIGYNEKSISATIGGSSSKELSRESEETPSELSQGLGMSLSALPQVPENTPSKQPQVPTMNASKLPHVPGKTPSKLSQVRAMTAPKLPQVPEKTPSKLMQVPIMTAPKLPQVPETSPSKLTQVPIMTAPKVPQVPETSPSKLSQVPAMTAPKFPQVPEKTPSKLSQVPATTAPKLPQVPEKTPSKLSQVPATTNPKLPQVPEMTPSKLLHEPVKTPIPSNFSVQMKNEASPTARMQLYEICVARHWKRPLFVLFKEEGPSHQRMFTFKVILELKGISTADLECYSEPRQQKKAAQENAAEGALWYLKHLGVLPKT